MILVSWDEEQGQQKYHLTMLDESWTVKHRLTRDSAYVLTTPPCNGLICLYDYHRNIKLCNPTTEEFLDLPRPAPNDRRIRNGFPKCFFGFDHIMKEYKVVHFFYRRLDHNTESYDLGCEVLTLGTNLWRYIGNTHNYLTGPGINVNGSIYWTSGVRNLIPDQIIALDLRHEKFRSILPPDFTSYEIEEHESMSLVQLEGNLCLVDVHRCTPTTMDIWMLKDYTNNVWILRYHLLLNSGYDRFRPEPIFIHGERLLLRWGKSLYYLNLFCKDEPEKPSQKEGEVEKVYTDECLGSCTKAYAFVESLLPLRYQGF